MAEHDVTDYNAQIAQSSSDIYRVKALAQAADSLLWDGKPGASAADVADSVGRILELVISESDRVAGLLLNLPKLDRHGGAS